MLERIISGGQTGADQGGLRAARLAGIPTGGWAPKGWETEDGPAPWLADFGLVECEVPGYAARTERNAREGHCTLWFGDPNSRGGRTTLKAVERFGTGVCRITPGLGCRPSTVVDFLWRNPQYTVVNVAGNRESISPGIGDRVERFLLEVFRQLRRLEGIPPPGPIGKDWWNDAEPY
jgi:hypothetical protein